MTSVGDLFNNTRLVLIDNRNFTLKGNCLFFKGLEKAIDFSSHHILRWAWNDCCLFHPNVSCSHLKPHCVLCLIVTKIQVEHQTLVSHVPSANVKSAECRANSSFLASAQVLNPHTHAFKLENR